MSRDLEADVFEEYIQTALRESKDLQPRGASVFALFLLAMPIMACQIAWSAQWAALGPLLDTMLPHYAVQLTQVIGPLSGLVVAPVIGVLSDRCTSKWGRRRPFIAFGALSTCTCWGFMSYTRELGELLGDYGNGKPGVPTSRTYTGILTIVFYAWMDIAVNIIQPPAFLLVSDFAGDRQITGNALGMGWSAVGTMAVSGYISIFGAAHLSLGRFMGMLIVVMLATNAVACIVGREKPLHKASASLEGATTWQRIGDAFRTIRLGITTLPRQLFAFFLICVFTVFGYMAYCGNKGMFFGYEVYGGDGRNADICKADCTAQQNAFNHGVKVAGGTTDLMYNLVGYVFTWVMPFIVVRIGVKALLTIALIPQVLLAVMAFSKIVAFDVFVVVATAIPQATIFSLMLPTLVYIFGPKAEIGLYYGALNSSNCIGQLLIFLIGAPLVETSLRYKFPVLLGGIFSGLALIVCVLFFRIKLYSL